MENNTNPINQYAQSLEHIQALKAELASLEYDYLLPQEKESLKQFPFFPAQPIEYFSRFQVINILTTFQIGITLQSRFYDLSIDKNQENGKVSAL